jgi:hypothetical protein
MLIQHSSISPSIAHEALCLRKSSHAASASIVLAAALLPAACNNTYGPPPDGTPQNWGQQHYLDV